MSSFHVHVSDRLIRPDFHTFSVAVEIRSLLVRSWLLMGTFGRNTSIKRLSSSFCDMDSRTKLFDPFDSYSDGPHSRGRLPPRQQSMCSISARSPPWHLPPLHHSCNLLNRPPLRQLPRQIKRTNPTLLLAMTTTTTSFSPRNNTHTNSTNQTYQTTANMLLLP